MNSRTLSVTTIASVVLVFVLHVGMAEAFLIQSKCPDVSSRGYLNVLTINLLFSEIEERNSRLEAIADWVAWETDEGEPVDLILLQEVAGGQIAQTFNVGLDLYLLLANRSLPYNLRYRLANGFRDCLRWETPF